MIWDFLQFYVTAYPALLCAWVVLLALLQVLRRESRPAVPSGGGRLSVAILVPARNEELVLTECLEALLTTDWPHTEIQVLSDGSTDGTEEIARSFASRGVRLAASAVNRGKSEVLEEALAALTSDLVMVVDADTRLDPRAVREMVALFAAERVGGATANIRVSEASSFLSRLQQMEYASIIGLLKRANGFWGGLFTVSGAAACFRVAAVRAVGGFRSTSATEDIDLSWRLQREGWRLAYAPRAHVSVRVPERLPALWRQRRRWSQGLVEVLRLQGDVWRHRSLVLLPFIGEALASILWAFLLAATLPVFLGQWIATGGRAVLVTEFWSWQAFTMAMFLVQSITAWVLDDHYRRQSPWLLLLAVFYPGYFLVVVFPCGLAGWVSGLFSHHAARWERTARE